MGRVKNEFSRVKKVYFYVLKEIIIMFIFMKGVNGIRMCCGCIVRFFSLCVKCYFVLRVFLICYFVNFLDYD